jgi:hypothetical protein
LGTTKNPHTIKVNVQLTKERQTPLKKLLLEYKDVFAWTYKDLKAILPKLAQHCIGLDTSIPPTHHARYRLHPNYVIIIKQDIDELLVIGFI